MNTLRTITVILTLLLGGHALAQAQDMDTELAKLSDKLATQIKDQGKKKVAVLDFTDLQGGSSELGKYIAEQFTVNLVMNKRDFSVLDRANLKSILAEHKLTATGLIDPENAKKLGMFAGVDALILGTIIPKGQNTSINAKIITTDTAEIVGAARAEFTTDNTVQQLASKSTTESNAGGNTVDLNNDTAKVVKKFGDLRVELQSLHIVNRGQFQLTMALINQNPKKSIWVALNSSDGINPRGNITDSGGFKFVADRAGVSGIPYASYGPYGSQQGGFSPATEIKPGDSISATVAFTPFDGSRRAAPGICNLQIEFLLGHDFNGSSPSVGVNNLVSKIEAD
jgi:TolB-like protein